MRRTLIVALAGAALLVAPAAQAAPSPFDPAAVWPIQSKYCAPTAPIVVNVSLNVSNHVDRGVVANSWAMDSYRHTLIVRRISGNRYCAAMQYSGSFRTLGGISPGGTGFLSDGVTGVIAGSAKSTDFTARFRPFAPTSGYIGSFDFGCDAVSCSGARDWISLYFDQISGYRLDWFNFVYQLPDGRFWADRSTGDYGDITG